MPSDNIKIDLGYKRLNRKEYTSIEKSWHEEFPGKPFNIKLSEIWMSKIPSIPPTSTTEIVEVINSLELTEDITVKNQRSWHACSTPGDLSTKLNDWIQPDEEIPQQYYIRIYDNSGKQIFVGDPVNWEFDYANGILTFENDPSSFTYPFRISGYRYIGEKGTNDSFITSLDAAYDGPDGSGGGRIIEADFGPVVINPSNGSAALQINPQEYTPVTGLDGQIINRNGIMYLYDDSRGKWLSMMRQSVSFGVRRADGCYLNVSDFSSSMSGWPALRNGTITGITVQASGGYSGKGFTMSLNNDPTSVHSFNLVGHYYAKGDLNIDFEANDLIKILTSSQYGVTHNVVANLEISWRV